MDDFDDCACVGWVNLGGGANLGNLADGVDVGVGGIGGVAEPIASCAGLCACVVPHDFEVGVAQAVGGAAARTVYPFAAIAVYDLVEGDAFIFDEAPEAAIARIADVVKMVVAENADINVGSACDGLNLLGDVGRACARVPRRFAHVNEDGEARREDD